MLLACVAALLHNLNDLFENRWNSESSLIMKRIMHTFLRLAIIQGG